MTDLNDYLKSGRYLPEPIRDFHVQKELFKYLHGIAAKKAWASGCPDWVTCQIYVIDVFLWVMAISGYTLQKTRIKSEHLKDLSETLDAASSERVSSCLEALKQRQMAAQGHDVQK